MDDQPNQFSSKTKRFFRNFSSLPSHQKVLVVVLLVLAIPVTVYLFRTFTLYLTRAATVQLSFSPASATVSPDARLGVMLNAGSSRVAFARAVVRFDRTKVRVGDVTVPQVPGNPPSATAGLYKPVVVSTPSQANGNGTGIGEVVIVMALCGDRDPSCETNQRPNLPSVFQLASIRFTPVAGQTGSTTVSYNLADVQVVEDNQAVMSPSGSNATLSLVGGPTPTGSACGTRAGDTNNDGLVDILDIGNVVRAYGSNPVSNPCADLDHNNAVDILDIGIVVRNYDP